jgi:hypothetical protein
MYKQTKENAMVHLEKTDSETNMRYVLNDLEEKNFRGDSSISVQDLDSGEYLPEIVIYKTRDAAIAAFDKIKI